MENIINCNGNKFYESEQLLDAYHESGTVLAALHCLTHLIPSTILLDRYNYHPHLLAEKSKAQKNQNSYGVIGIYIDINIPEEHCDFAVTLYK